MTNQESVLNPYDVLEVSQAASANEIAQAFAKAMKQRKYPIGAIATARKQLMNPKDRLVADYLRPVLPTIQRLKRSDFSALESAKPRLELLPYFDGLERVIAQSIETSELGKRLGTLLFSVSPMTSASVTVSSKLSMEALRSTVAKQVAEQVQIARQAIPALTPTSKPPAQALLQTEADSRIVGGAIGVAVALAVAGIAILWGGTRQPEIRRVSSNSVPTLQDPIPLKQTEATDYSTETPGLSSYPTPSVSVTPSLLPSASTPSPIAVPSTSPSPISSSSSSAASVSKNTSVKPTSLSRSASIENEPVSSRTPEDSCGDRDPGGINIWYPVYISYSERNLEQSRKHYCRDAIKNYRESNQKFSVQIASFLSSSEAQKFASFMQTEIGSGEVGEGTTYRFTPNEATASHTRDFSFPMASCGDRSSGAAHTWYPVIIYTATENLSLIRTNYCGDAFRGGMSNNSSSSIQVASFFKKSDAENFSKTLRRRFTRVEVGDPYQF